MDMGPCSPVLNSLEPQGRFSQPWKTKPPQSFKTRQAQRTCFSPRPSPTKKASQKRAEEASERYADHRQPALHPNGLLSPVGPPFLSPLLNRQLRPLPLTIRRAVKKAQTSGADEHAKLNNASGSGYGRKELFCFGGMASPLSLQKAGDDPPLSHTLTLRPTNLDQNAWEKTSYTLTKPSKSTPPILSQFYVDYEECDFDPPR